MSARTCDGCTVCCTVMSVKTPEFDKPEYRACEKACPTGCSIYKTRPEPCEGYSCLWLIDEGKALRDEDKPSVSGLLFEMSGIHRKLSPFEERTGIAFLVVREAFPGAFDAYRGKKTLQRLSKKVLIICAYQDGRRFAIGPPEKLRVWADYVKAIGHAPQANPVSR